MKIWLVAVVLLAATSAGAAPKKAAKEAATKPTVDPNIDVAKVHGGKVWVMSDSIPTSEGGELAKWLTAHPATRNSPARTMRTGGRSTFWPCSRSAGQRPDNGHVGRQERAENHCRSILTADTWRSLGLPGRLRPGTEQRIQQGPHLRHPVGQLIKGKFQLYASGDITLK